MSPARACAFAVVRRVFEHGAYADRAFAAEAAELEGRDRALAMRMAYGVVQRRGTLDHVAAALVRSPLRRLEPAVLAALRLGLFQLLYLDGVPAHAAVDESVELVKRTSPGGARLLNAVLRRAAVQGDALLAGLDDGTPEAAATLHSVPVWLAEMWWAERGAQEARALLRAANEPAESALRVNLLAASVEEVAAELPVGHHPVADLPEALVLEGPFDAWGSLIWERGAIMPQSRASMLVSRVLAPQPRERVLDLCAAPGAKSTHLAALMDGTGQVLAVERHPGRASALRRTSQRMRADTVTVVDADAVHLHAQLPGLKASFDRVLVDPPCSGLGTLRSRPDVRWRTGPQRISELASLQGAILAAGAAAVRPGGALVYSVCTISRSEGRDVVEGFLAGHPEFTAENLASERPEWADRLGSHHLQLLPHRDGTDGFFIARLRRHRG